MQENQRATIAAVFEASQSGAIHFGEVVSRLASVPVESYHVDYRSGRATYFLPDGGTVDMLFEHAPEGIADAFNVDAVRAAIRGAQQGQVMYPEFKRLTQRAGCVGYTVWLAGRHVAYLGRRGEVHVERFPD